MTEIAIRLYAALTLRGAGVGRWIHPCHAVDAVFGVLAPHACPICGEECPAAIRAEALEYERRAVVETQAVD